MKSGIRRGFTLIELLVVMAIIGILASMLFPVFAQAREKTREIVCISNMKQLGMAFGMYEQDNGNFPFQDHLFIANCPPCSFWLEGDYGVPDWFNAPYANWAQGIYSYIKNTEVYACKSNKGWTPLSNRQMPGTSYVYNGYAAGKSESAVPSSSDCVLLWDYRYLTSFAVADPVPDGWAFTQEWAPHPERFNVLYFDMHAKTKHATQMQNDFNNMAAGQPNPFAF